MQNTYVIFILCNRLRTSLTNYYDLLTKDIPMLMCEAIINALGLDAPTRNVIIQCMREVNHQEWYWRMMERGRLSHEQAYTVSVAMHIDRSLPFDEATCTIPPPNATS